MNRAYDDNQYRAALDDLRFSDAAKQRMTERLLAAAEAEPVVPMRRKRTRRLPRIAAVGVAAALVLGVGAGATGVLKTAGEAFAGVFGPTADTEIIDKIGRPVGAHDTDNGVTITADAIIGDKYHYAITYSIEKEDGTPFDLDLTQTVGAGLLPLTFADEDTTLVGYRGGAHGSAYFYDADPTDNAIQYVETREVSDDTARGRTVRARFRDLRAYDEQMQQMRVVAPGSWSLKFDLDFEDTSIDLPAGQTIDLNGMTATIDQITLSPLALRVDYTVDSEIRWDENATDGRISAHDSEQMRRYFEDLPIVVHKKDGSSLDLSNAGGGVHPADGKTICQKGDIFDEIVPLDEVASVAVGGIEIAVQP
ncbi:MAG: DUF4179 domain-containing protein [Eubacteriales bacterium]|nr:DUF4179 domain-containing protein [Eubacteriales bacterium]